MSVGYEPHKADRGQTKVGGNLHFADESVFVNRPTLLSVCKPWRLCPDFLDVLKHHVAVPVEGLNTGQQLAIVADRNQDLPVRSYSRL